MGAEEWIAASRQPSPHLLALLLPVQRGKHVLQLQVHGCSKVVTTHTDRRWLDAATPWSLRRRSHTTQTQPEAGLPSIGALNSPGAALLMLAFAGCCATVPCGGARNLFPAPRQFLPQPTGSAYIISREVHNRASQAAAGSAELDATVSALHWCFERQPAPARQLCTPLLPREACSRGALLRGRCRAGQKGWLQTTPARQLPTAVSGSQSRQRRVCRTSDKRTTGACARRWFGGCVCAAFADGVGLHAFCSGTAVWRAC